MTFFHGVTTTLNDIGPRPITVPSSSIIGLVDTYTPNTGLVAANTPTVLTSPLDAATKFGAASRIAKAYSEIYQQSQAVVVAIGVGTNADADALRSAIIGGVDGSGHRTGLQALLDAKPLLGLQPRLLLAPGHSKATAVATAMQSLAAKLRAVAIIDGPSTTDADAIDYAGDWGDKRLYLVDPGVRVWDTGTNARINRPASPVTAGLFAQADAAVGFWASPSNRIIAGITGTTRPIEYLDNDPTCRAQLLNDAFVTTIINDNGFRLWGNRGLSSDAKWSFITRVRTLDMVMDAVQAGHKWAVDRNITKTYAKDVTEGLNNFMRLLKAKGAVLGFEVFLDPDLNLASELADGRIYWNVRFTDSPPAENPIFRFEVTDQWVTEILDVTN